MATAKTSSRLPNPASVRADPHERDDRDDDRQQQPQQHQQHGQSPPSLDHEQYMRLALMEALKSPPRPTNFCVGACLVAGDDGRVLATGYTLECAGNTHAEQCCILKLAASTGCAVEDLGRHLPAPTALYTTMEPCSQRSAGHAPCVERILQLRRDDGRPAIATVYVGVDEPATFVGTNIGRERLQQAGIAVVHVAGFAEEILRIATAGHDKSRG